MGGDNFAELFKGPSCYDNIVGSKARDHPEQTWTKAYKAKKGPVLEKCIVCSEMRVEKLESRSRMCPSCIRYQPLPPLQSLSSRSTFSDMID